MPAASRLDLYREIVATVQWETLNAVFNLPWAGCLWSSAMDLIPEYMRVVAPPIVHLVMAVVKHLLHVWKGGSPPLPKKQTPASEVRPHPLELWNWQVLTGLRTILSEKRSYALPSLTPPTLYVCWSQWRCSRMNPCIWSHSNGRRQFETDVSIIAPVFPIRLLLPLVPCVWVEVESTSEKVALWFSCSGMKARGRVQSGEGYRVCFGTRGVILCKSCDAKIRFLSVLMLQDEQKKEVKKGRWDIYTWVLGISWYKVQLVSFVG